MEAQEALYKTEKTKLSPEEIFLEGMPSKFVKMPVGDSFVEFLDEGGSKEITYAEGDKPKLMRVYMVNHYDARGTLIQEKAEWACPNSLLNAVKEIRGGADSLLAGKWLKVTRSGTTKTDTKYLGWPARAPGH